MSPEARQKMKSWLDAHKNKWAKALLSAPTKRTLRRVIPFPGVILIMGDYRSGKTGLAMQIMDDFHAHKGLGGAVCYPEKSAKLRRLLPSWVKIVISIKDLPPNSICVVDEASQIAHARRTSSQAAIDMDGLCSISGQKNQLIIFVSHHARKLDINDIHASRLLIWKRPTLADTIWEREELQPYVLRAWEIFQGMTPKKQLQSAYVMNLRQMEFSLFRNSLPSWWSHELSTVFKIFSNGKEKTERRRKHSEPRRSIASHRTAKGLSGPKGGPAAKGHGGPGRKGLKN